MIEARVPWTLEGPNDSIVFNGVGSPWMLVSKPKTAVDDRGDDYDYPLDDGGVVGDAFAGKRVWTFQVKLRASSHAERNTELQRLSALLNSLRRADGLLKWQPTGFPAVQCTVRRNGSVDAGSGANMHLGVSFSLKSGDPRVYSQELKSVSAGATTVSYGPNLLSANNAGFETSVGGWVSQSGSVLTRTTAAAHTGAASLRIEEVTAASSLSALSPSISVSPGDVLHLGYWGYSPDLDVSLTLSFKFYDSLGSQVASGVTNTVPISPNTWSYHERETTPAPVGAASMAFAVGRSHPGPSAGEYVLVDDVTARIVSRSSVVDVTNQGDADTPPKLVITGPATNPSVHNYSTQTAMPLDAAIIASELLTVDTAAREIYSGPALTTESNLYSAKGPQSAFPTVLPGANEFAVVASLTSGGTELEVLWRDAWMP